MKKLNKHIALAVILSTLFVVFVLVGFQLFVSFFQELSDFGKGGYTFLPLMEYVFLSLPANVYSFFPMAGLVGALLGLSLLAANNELMVMRAAGVSVMQIIRAVIYAALIMAVVAILIGEILGPGLNKKADTIKTNALMHGNAVSTLNGVWLHQNNLFIRIDKVISNAKLSGITQYSLGSDYNLKSIEYAENASKIGGKWYLENITATNLNSKISSFKTKKLNWPVVININLLRLLQADPENMSLPKLVELIKYRNQNGLSTSDLRLSFWQRIVQPFSILVLIFLSAPIIFGPLRSSTLGLRLMYGILLGFIFFLANRFFGPISLYYQVNPIIGATLPLIIFFGFGIWMTKRTR